jgi:hypothetical protein
MIIEIMFRKLPEYVFANKCIQNALDEARQIGEGRITRADRRKDEYLQQAMDEKLEEIMNRDPLMKAILTRHNEKAEKTMNMNFVLLFITSQSGSHIGMHTTKLIL